MFLKNGFQAFLPKPIEMARLDAVIHQWVRDKELENTLEHGQITVNGQALLDIRTGKDRRANLDRRTGIDRRTFNREITGLDIKKGIDRFDGDEDSYLKVLHSYASNTMPLLDTVRNVNKDSLKEYSITVHGIKSSSYGICADIAGTKAETLEKAAKAGDLDFVNANNPAFIEVVEKLVADIQEMLGKISTENPKPLKAEPDRETLLKLLNACGNYEMDEVDAAMAEIESFEYSSNKGLTAWLRENVEQMNFDLIIEKISAMVPAEE